jgi:hypothetical protein
LLVIEGGVAHAVDINQQRVEVRWVVFFPGRDMQVGVVVKGGLDVDPAAARENGVKARLGARAAAGGVPDLDGEAEEAAERQLAEEPLDRDVDVGAPRVVAVPTPLLDVLGVALASEPHADSGLLGGERVLSADGHHRFEDRRNMLKRAGRLFFFSVAM